jgi:hypothetical protein
MAAAVDFVLEGMHARKAISRSDAGVFTAGEEPARRSKAERRRERQRPTDDDDDFGGSGGSYYN